MRGLLWWCVALPLLPAALVLAKRARRNALRLPPAAGASSGMAGGHLAGRPLRVLLVGESTVVGVGVESLQDALAAQLARSLSERLSRPVGWRVCGENGIRLAGVLERLLPRALAEPADLVLLVLGVNDTTGLSGRRHWQEGLRRLIGLCRSASGRVVLVGVPPMRHFSALPWLLRQLLGWRAALLDGWGCQAASRHGALHVPARLTFEPHLLAGDGYHPSRDGYRLWAEDLAEQCLASFPDLDGRATL